MDPDGNADVENPDGTETDRQIDELVIDMLATLRIGVDGDVGLKLNAPTQAMQRFVMDMALKKIEQKLGEEAACLLLHQTREGIWCLELEE